MKRRAIGVRLAAAMARAWRKLSRPPGIFVRTMYIPACFWA